MCAAAIWISVCAYLTCAGWFLSAVHQLDTGGYVVAVAMGGMALLVWRQKTSPTLLPRIRWSRWRRFRKPFPAIYLGATVLIFLGGAIHAPNNYDALTYRLPRMLNWLSAGHWFWIPTVNARRNYSSTGWEWVGMPFLALLRSDRELFLINALPFLLFPGLLFSVFRRLGVARRVAWTWMWILPLGYGFVMQAGSIGNDLTGAIFCVGSVYFGLRARRSGRMQDVWLSALAAALMTNAKLSNLPLLLPCLAAVWPALPQLRERLLPSLGILIVAVMISGAPNMLINQVFTGSWTGDPHNSTGMRVTNPLAAALGNGLMLAQQSFMPPMLPAAAKVTDAFNKHLPASWRRTLKKDYPRYFSCRFNELPQEEGAGLGLGVTALLLGACVATVFGIGRKDAKPKTDLALSLVGYSAWIAVAVYMIKMGAEAPGRLMLPYYSPAVIPILLLPSQNRLFHSRGWRVFAALAALSVLPALVLTPSRPLFPVQSIGRWLAQRHPGNAVSSRIESVYSVYANRNDALAPIRASLPQDAREIGSLVGSDDSDYSLWRPFGQRRVIELQSGPNGYPEVPNGVKWIVVKKYAWGESCKPSVEEWAAEHHGRIVLTVPIRTLAQRGAETWLLVHLESP